MEHTRSIERMTAALLAASALLAAAALSCRRAKETAAPTLEEAGRVAAVMEKAVEGRDLQAFVKAFSIEGIAAVAMSGVAAPPEQQKAFVQDVAANGPGRELMGLLSDGAQWRLLRMSHRDAQYRALFRLIPAIGGVHYYDAVITRLPDGQVRVADIYDFKAGEAQSNAMRRRLLEMLASAGGNPPPELKPWEQDYLKSIQDYHALEAAVAETRWGDGIDAYKRLPEALRQTKPALSLLLRATYNYDPKEYARAAAVFRELYPGDPCFDLINVDHCFLAGDNDQALETLDRIDKTFGGDPYLNVLRAGLHLKKKDLDQAAAAARKAVEGPDGFKDGYFVLLNVALERKQFDEAARALEGLKGAFPLSREALSRAPHFSEFVQSPHFPKWIEEKSPAPSVRPGAGK